MQAISVSATYLTHNYVLYVVAMNTEGVIYSRQHYFKLFSDFFDPQSSLLSVLQSQACPHKKKRVSRLFAFDF